MMLVQDVRHSLRMLRRSPGFTAVALITLALGIGANTAIFSVVDAVVLEPLDYTEPGRIMRLQTSWAGEPRADISPAEYFDYRDELDVFSSFGVYALSSSSLTGGDRPERLRGAFVSSGLLPALGAEPLLGRVFTAEEELPGHDVAILGFELWQRRFGGAEEIVGERVILDGRARTIVGILPAGFRMPEDYTEGEVTDVYLPLGVDRTTIPNRGSHFLAGVGRRAPGVTVERAAAAVEALARSMVEDYPDDYPADMRFAATAYPLADAIVGPMRPALFVLLAAVGLVLLVACANVANLLIARAEAREGEFALRAALGAGRGRILRQLVVETTVLTLLGGILGLLLAAAGIELLIALQPPDVPRIDGVTIDWRVLAFTTATAGLTGLLLGMLPGMQASRAQPAAALRESGARSTGGRRHLRGVLVIAEIAIAVVLVIGATLLVRSYAELRQVDAGYRVEGVLTTDVTLTSASYPEEKQVTRFYRELLGHIAQLPGVAAAGAVSNLPLATELGDLSFEIEGRESAAGAVSPSAYWQAVTPGYFGAMRIPLLSGHGIEETDPVRGLTLVVRTPGEPAALVGMVRHAVAEFDPALPLADFRTMEQVVSESLARPRLMMSLLATFAAVALVMGAVGVYGVMAWLVGRRTRELGIRLALGAKARDVAGLVLKQSLALTVAGIAGGLVLAAMLTRALAGMLYGVTPLDGWTFAGVTLALAAVALLAALVPTWRAARINPSAVLRHE